MKTDPLDILRAAEKLVDELMLERIEQKMFLQDENLCADPKCGFCADWKKLKGLK